jgi:serine-type D-Ala-D-Ala carboxypeptidase/endopeptidase
MRLNVVYVLCIALSLLLLAAVTAHSEGLDLGSRIDPLVEPLIDDGILVGCVVVIVQDGKSQILAYGETKKDSGQKPTEKTIYEIGSSSKALTGLLLADMVQAGLVKLDDKLQEFVPRGITVPTFDDKPITLEHLATHTSGLPRLPDNMQFKNPRNPYADYTKKQMYTFLNDHKLRRSPGEYEYSNYGMGLLGHVLAEHQKKSYEGLLINRIIEPLDMGDTRIKLTAEQRKRLAPPYNEELERDKNWDIPILAGAGAIRSTAGDMLKFVEANLAQDDSPITKAVRLSHVKRHTMKDGQAMGLGWHIARDRITRWHNGMTGGYSSWVSVVPKFKAGVVVLSNTASGKTTELGEQLTRVACGIKVTPPRTRTAVDVAPDVLKTYAGYFEITPQFGLTVTVEDGKLMVQATGQSKFPVFAESDTKFFYRVVDAQITFSPNDEGKVDELTLHQNGVDMKAKRQN